MIDLDHLTDPDPRVAALLALAPILSDWAHEHGRIAVRGIVPGITDEHADQVLEEIADQLATAERHHDTASRRETGEFLRAEWIDHARDSAWHAILRTENRVEVPA